MAVNLRLARPEEKPAIAVLLRRYLVELGPWGYGEEDYPFLDSYWREERRAPYFIESDGDCAGFVFVNAVSISGYAVDGAIAEFYVLPEFRRRRCGEEAAASAFRTRRGEWELSFHRDNVAARNFWPRAVERAGASRIRFFDVGESRILRFRMKTG
jgi:predicted acetyltransferase